MNQSVLEEIICLLKAISSRMKTEIQEAINKGLLKPGNELILQPKVPKLTISERGVQVPNKRSQWIIKESWLMGNYGPDLIEKVRKSKEFDELVAYLSKFFEENSFLAKARQDAWGLAITFTNDIYFLLLPDFEISEHELETYISSFANHIIGKPYPFWLEAQVRGIIILFQSIEIQSKSEERFYFRQITTKDLEKERRGFEFLSGNRQSEPILNSFFDPSAVLRIECIAKDGQNILNQTRKALVILRLYKTGGVRIASHEVKSGISHYGSGTDFNLSIQTLQDGLDPVKEYTVNDSEKRKFKNFWRIMSERLPENIYKIDKPINHVTLAYDRYCDGLLRDNSFEKKIASAIMGLEALFLPKHPDSELKHRLSMNTGKIMGAIGENALEVKENIAKAYNIRSTYAHGGKVSKKDEEKIKKEFGSTLNFILIILGYLRISILVFILLGLTKESLQSLIGEAMLDNAKEKELVEMVKEVRKYL